MDDPMLESPFFSGPTLSLSTLDQSRDLLQVLYYLEDPGGGLSLDEASESGDWLFTQTSSPHFGLTSSVIWLKFEVLNKSGSDLWLLELSNPLVDSVNLFVSYPDSRIDAYITGIEHPFAMRPYRHRNLVFPVNIKQEQTVQIYLRVTSGMSLKLPLKMWREEALVLAEERNHLFYGLFFGCVLMLMLIHLLMYYNLGDKTHVMFVLFIMSFFLTQSNGFGFSFQYWWPGSPSLNQYGFLVFPAATLCCLALFYKLLYRSVSGQLYRTIDRLMVGVASVSLALVILSFFITLKVIKLVYIAASLVLLVGAMTASAAQFKENHGKESIYAFIASCLLVVGLVLDSLEHFYDLSAIGSIKMIWPFCLVLFSLFISIASVEKINSDRTTSQAAEKELEEELAEKEEAEKNLMHCITHDGNTGCGGRQLLLSRLDTMIDAEEYEHMSLVLLNLNRFKEIEYTIGHLYSSELLVTVAKRLCDLAMETPGMLKIELVEDEHAWVAVWDGPMYALLTIDSEEEKLSPLIDRILDAVGEPIVYEGMTLDLNGHLGVASYPAHGRTANELLQRASVGLDVAQNKEIDCVMYSPEIDPYSARQLSLASELKHGLLGGELELHYQPQVDLRNDVVLGAEALVRWIHPKYGFIPPDEFIVIAEQTGIIRDLTAWVLETALTQLSVWSKRGYRLKISINLSAKNLREDDLVERLTRLTVLHDIQPEWLALEITETAMMSDPQQALEVLNVINETGIGLSVDDFGTGYSSLAYLKQLPVTELKIDRSFVMDMCNNMDDQVIVNTTLNMSHSLGMGVVAEGVEDNNSLVTLKRLGCDIAQGYYLCRPCPAEAFEQWLEKTEFQMVMVNGNESGLGERGG